MIILAAIYSIGSNQFYMIGYHNGMKLRVAVCNLIYKKSLRLSQTALGDTSPGKLVNLLSNDMNRFDLFTILMSAMWGAPVVTLIAAALVWAEAGWAAMYGLTVVFIVVPIMSRSSSLLLLKTAIKSLQNYFVHFRLHWKTFIGVAYSYGFAHG